MNALSDLILSLAGVVIQVLSLLIIARALLSWFIQDPFNPLMRTLNDLTEPILAPIRNRLGGGMGIDLSPLIAIIGLQILGQLLEALLRN